MVVKQVDELILSMGEKIIFLILHFLYLYLQTHLTIKEVEEYEDAKEINEVRMVGRS